jgi:hypothetical protein
MSDVQTRAARIWEHIEDIKLGRQLRGGHFAGNFMTQREGVRGRDFVARIKGAECLPLVPNFLPFGLDQVKWILPAAARHRKNSLPVQWLILKSLSVDFRRLDHSGFWSREGHEGMKRSIKRELDHLKTNVAHR